MALRSLRTLLWITTLACACKSRELPPAQTEAAPSPVTVPAAPAPEPAFKYPVSWSEDLGLASLAAVDARLAKDDPIGFGELALGAERVVPTSCKRWADLKSAGYEPSTALEAQADAGAVFQCEVLRLLKRAHPARVSFVRELPDGTRLLGILPAAVATAESPERAGRLAPLVEKGAPLSSFDPKAKVVNSPTAGVTRVAEGDGQSVVDVQPKAWGDFDGDGVDDVVIAVRNSMTEGSVSMARVLLLTRHTGTDTLQVMALAR